jgi:hypothetical protein
MDAQSGGTGMTGLQASVPTINVRLRDDDKTLWLKMRDAQVQGITAKVYLAYYGEDPTYFKLFEGSLSSKPKWVNGALSLSMSTTEKTFDEEIGTLATTDILPDVYPDHAGKMLPIVYGAATRVKAIAAAQGMHGRMREDATDSDTVLYIEGFESKDPSELVRIRVGDEEITGHFKGSRFEVVERGGTIVASGLLIGNTLISRPNQLFASTNDLGEDDNRWAGYKIRLTVPRIPDVINAGWKWNVNRSIGAHGAVKPSSRFGVIYREIVRYNGTTGSLIIGPPFSYESTLVEDESLERGLLPGNVVTYAGHSYLPPSGQAYEIVTKRKPHRVGEDVWEVLSTSKYIIADHPIKAVRAIYAFGKRVDVPVPRKRPSAFFELGGGVIGMLGREGFNEDDADTDQISEWIEIPPELYKVNLDDGTAYPAIGHNIATIEFFGPVPTLSGFEFDGPEVLVDMEGKDDAGTMIQNPITVLKDILDNWAPSIATNAASFTAAAALVDWLKVDFSLTDRMQARDLISSLSWQSRCRSLWKDGALFVDFLRNKSPGSHVGFIYGDVVEGTRKFELKAMRSIVTELEYKITSRGEEKTFKEEDAIAVSKYGRRGIGIKDFWAYEREAHAQAVARFWLNRMKSESLIMNVDVPLNQARGEPSDWFKVYASGFLLSYTDMEVIGTKHNFGSPKSMQSPKITLSLMNPYGWEAPWVCPNADGCTGCDLYCEVAADVLPCVTASDIGCSIFDMGGYATWDFDQRSITTL